MSSEKMIEVKGLTKQYREVRAVDGVTFEVNRGEVLGFLGPNGAGKTTTMKVLTCFIAPTSGEVRVGGVDIYKDPLEIRRKVGYLPENAPLYTDMRVSEFLEFISQVRGIEGSLRKKAIDKVVDTCGLGTVFEREIRTLSKGFRQRVGLAQAMVHSPEIMILDEPTSGLDPNQIAEIRELIKSIGKERTVILSTHNLAEVQAATGRVIIIHQGKLVADGSPQELESARGGARYDVVLSKPQDGMDKVRDVFSQIAGVHEVALTNGSADGEMSAVVRGKGDADLRADIFRAAVNNNWVLLGLGRKQVDLEAIFRRLTTSDAETAAAQAK